MGSKFGKSTEAPAGMARMCGLNVLSFCTIRACAGDGRGARPPAGSSHTTTPEKSIFLRTAASLESRSSIWPETEAARQGPASKSATANLKQVCDRQVIVREDPCPGVQERGPRLRSLDARQYVRSEAIHEIASVGLILGDAARLQIAIAIVFLAAVNIQGGTRGQPELE